MKSTAKRLVAEIFLWNTANVLCTLLPTAAVYLIGTVILGWGPGFTSFYVTAALLTTLTWGSWASLVWTSNRGLRGGMLATTLLPGVLTTGAGLAGFWAGFGAWYMWAGIIGAGLGTVAVAVSLTRYFRPLNRVPGRASYLVGFAVYPLVTTAVGLVIATLWYNFVTGALSEDWRGLISIATLYATVIASVLVSTVIPATVSSTLRKISGDLLN